MENIKILGILLMAFPVMIGIGGGIVDPTNSWWIAFYGLVFIGGTFLVARK